MGQLSGHGPVAIQAWATAGPPAAAHLWPDLLTLLADLSGSDPGELLGQIHRVRAFYAPLLERLHDNPRARLLDLEQLQHLSGRFPDRARFLAEIAEIDEELRLFNVALTRARDWLYVCCPLRYYPVPWRPTDSHGYAQITRFLPESVRRHLKEMW